MNPDIRVLPTIALSFDASLGEIFRTLLAGGTLCLARREELLPGPDLIRLLRDQHITTTTVVTAVLAALPTEEELPELHTLTVGGEALPAELAARWSRGRRLLNGYGPTEATIGATLACGWDPSRKPPLGKPLPNVRAYLLDGRMQLLPVGVPGELYLGGPGLARGYLGRPDLTAERFLADPFSGESSARLYRTGDRVRWLPDGQLEFMGRVDEQVKVRGFRIEPGEIELVLARHPGVRQAVVVATAQQQLAAYIVPAEGQAPAASELREFVRQQLPEYMVPALVMALEKLPLTPSGKVDRRALPAVEATTSATGYVEPGTSTEQMVAAVWAEVLRQERVGIHDNFFELGGHSLLATRVLARLRSAVGVDVPIPVFFNTPTVAGLAGWIEANRHDLNPDTAPPLVAAAPSPDGRREAPQSFAQQRLWFLAQLAPGSPLYSTQATIPIRGALDLNALERALTELGRRHESLRTTFGARDGEPIQIIAPPMPVHLSVVDLRSLPAGRRQAKLQRVRRAESTQPFDLARGPLIRFKLVRLEEQRQVLLLTMHHIITDGWSMGVLRGEVQALYEAFRAGQPSPLPEPSLQYADFAIWQRQWLQGEVLQKQLSYWKEKLAGAERLELPIDRPRPAAPSYASARQPFRIEPEVIQKLRDLSQQEEATLFMTLLAAFQVMLGRYSGQDDVVMGTPIANRTRTELEGLIGFFVNTLVMRTDLSGDCTFRQLLQRVRQTCLEAYAHQDLPFEKLVEELSPQRDLGVQPLFQVMFVLQNVPQAAEAAPQRFEAAAVGAPEPAEASNFDLTLWLTETASAMSGALQFNTDLFEFGTAERMVRHFQTLLTTLADQPDQELSGLSMLSEQERQQVLVEWNQTQADYDCHLCVHQLFELQAERTPDVVALTFEGAQLSYRELDRRANQLANRLRRLGVGPDVPVGIAAERSLELVIGLLGILKAGGAYVPLDPSYPRERLESMIADAAPPVLLTQARFASDLPGGTANTLLLDAEWPSITTEPERSPDVRLADDHLAYVIYTSGSTGQPKGAMNTHGGIRNRLLWMQQAYRIGEDDRVLQKTPFNFDVSVWEFFWPLITGARLVVARPGGHQDPAYLAALVAAERVTVMHFVPSMMRAFLEEPDLSGCESLRHVIASGEALPPDLERRFFERLPAELHNLYGPTEAAVDVTHWTCRRPGGRHPVPIGRPIANTRMYVLDKRMRPVPIGVPGGLFIAGVGLVRGYQGRPGLTAERFLPDPFATEAGSRMYHTGDLGRWLPDGQLEFLGRRDLQVKIRGFRIELGEIEARLAQHPAVREAVVLAREDTPGDKRLVAYYIVEPDADETGAEALRQHLSAALPEYMVPAAYVRLDALPLTANGKLDRRALPAPDAAAYAAREYEAPAGEIEMRLARIWADVLKLERVGRHDDFFKLGGHSLLAVTMISRMRQAGLQVDVRALFTTPTLAAVAAAVGNNDGVVEVPPNRIPPGCDAITPEMLTLVSLTAGELDRIVGSVPGGAANIQDIYPLAPLQEGMLFHHLIGSKEDPYLGERLSGFDSRMLLDRYVDALRAVIARHDILRTAVLWEGLAEPVQVVWREAPLIVEEVTLDPAAGDVAEQMRLRFGRRQFRLDVGQAPLMRLFIARDAVHHRWVALRLTHHLMTDHTTLEVMQQEIRAHLQGRAKELPAPLPFRNLVAQARLGVSREEHEAFFREMLGDVEEPTAPFGLVGGDGSGIGESRRTVDPALAKRLRACASALGVSAASLCHLAWALVVARVSGREDVVFGTVLFGRMQGGEGSDRVLGPFINTLPVRIRISEEGVADSVRHVHELLAKLLRHEHAPLALAQRCSAVAAPTPLFAALLDYRHSAGPAKAPGEGLRARKGIEFLGIEERTTYPFALAVDDLGEGFVLTAQVRSPIDPERICAFMHMALEQLSSALESAPTTPVRRLDVLPSAERRQIETLGNATDTAYPHDRCLHQLFELQAERAPDVIAVVYGDQQLSYGELNARANQLAFYLRGLGVTPDARVAICVERSLDMVVGLLAILKAGGAYVPLDPAYPAERLAYMLEDSAPVAVLTHAQAQFGLHAAVGAADVPVIDLEADAERWTRQPDSNPDRTSVGLTSQHLAYVIYTSGSTGQPKGVVISHSALCNHMRWMQAQFSFSRSTRVLQKTAISFDASVWEFYAPLLAGGQLVLAPPDVHREPAELVRIMAEAQVTVVQFVPTLLRVLLEESGFAACGSLVDVFCGGEALLPELASRFFASSGANLHNLYGPTEATIDVTWATCQRGADQHNIPIGRPITNARVYVLDDRSDLAPVGVAGELYIGGAGVARGYLNRPDLTAARFVADPFSDQPGARLYRTGDRVRWLPDGQLEFLGRVDHQVKVRGFRIEPDEVEMVLCRHPGVHQAVVVATDQQQLAAYVVTAEGQAPAATELREFARQHLPEYMVPALFMMLEKLPLTPGGKVDRRALPAVEATTSATGYVEPGTSTEQMVAAVWAEVLRQERVGIHDNFFELGGHSLLAMQVIARLRSAIGTEVPIPTFFSAPTVAGLAAWLEANRHEPAPDAAPPLVAAAPSPDGRREAPQSFAQQRLWFLAQLAPDSPLYSTQATIPIRGALDLNALERALTELGRRHESLRTTFGARDGEPIQIIAPPMPVHLSVVDLRSLPAGRRQAKLQRVRRAESTQPFDLARGPLIRFKLVRLEEQRQVLLLTMHHIITDGWSMGVLRGEVQALYEAFRAGQPSPLPEPSLQYADFAIWQRQWLQGEVLQKQLSYWKEKLAGAERLELPIDRPRPAAPSYASARQPFRIEPEVIQKLRDLSQQEEATLFMTLLAAFQVMLGRYSGQDDVVMGTPIANRTRTELEGLIGFFVNTLVMRTDLSGDCTFRQLLQRVRQTCLEAYAHQDLPFEKLVEELSPQRDLGVQPLFQVMFVLQNVPQAAEAAPQRFEAAAVGAPEPAEASNFDLTLWLTETASAMSGALQFNTDLFEFGTAERMVRHFQTLLTTLADQPDQELSGLSMLSEQERQQVLVEWNQTQADYDCHLCVHQLFELQAERTPDAIAVVYEDQQLSYGELNARANQLAHYLRGLGVGPETLIGLCVERSVEMVVGLLGILKAGGAYLPLDPTYPQERLAFMLQDAQVRLVVVHAPTRARLEGSPAQLVCLDADRARLDGEAETAPASGAGPNNPAYVIYTSGSTGQPKGCIITHANVARLFTATDHWFGFGPEDTWTLFHSIAFDFSVWELWGALLYGGKLVIVPLITARSPEQFHELLVQHRVTVLNQTPSAFKHLIVADEQSANSDRLALRYVIFGGEALEFKTLLPWIMRHGDEPALINMYGITETTVHVTYVKVPGEDISDSTASLIGKPIPDLRIYVLDRNRQLVPIGVPGELYVGGNGVARGYLNRPDLTAERFLADSFSDQPGARLYQTGDQVRWLPDGQLEFMGRVDEQVKVRGFRIEPGEIELVLARHPGVRQAVVLAREDTPGDKRLVAYYIVEPDADETGAEALRQHLSAALPEYMVPAAYVRLDALPLTANGKLDRRALPAPDAAAYAAAGEYEAPAGEIEIRLAQIWADVLRLERVGRHDDFFKLGGHSLLAVTMISRMRQAGLQVDVRALFTTPTLAAVAAAVGNNDGVVEVPPNCIPPGCNAITPEMLTLVSLTAGELDRIVGSVPGGAANIQDIYPLAPLQEGLLFHHLIGSKEDPYLLEQLIGFDSRMLLDRYVDALRAVIARHDILRTAVLWEGLAEPVQVVWREAPLIVEEVTLDPAAGDVAEQMRLRFGRRQFRLDVGQAPLMRLFIARDAVHHRWVALRLTHHLMTDHTTLEVMQQEIRAHLQGRAKELPAPLPFRNLVAQARLGVSREEHEAFFREMLGDVEEPTAPFGLVGGDGSGIGESRRTVDPALAKRLRACASALGVSAASLCHLAWALVVARVSGREDVVFGTVLFGRMQGGEGSDRVLGPFINTLPVRIRISEEGVADSVRHVHGLLAKLLRHEHAPLALAQRCSAVAAPTPLFAAALNYRHSAGPAEAPGDGVRARERIGFLGGEERTTNPFALAVDDLGEEFVLTAQVRSPIDPERICAFMHMALEQLSSALESAPTTPVRRLDVLPSAERRQIETLGNATDTAYPHELCIQELFEAQAERTPDAIAVVYEDQQLSYGELNARANQLAHHLRKLGVGPETPVGLCVERGLEAMIGLLGILKAGGVYVPLDPNLPAERLAWLLADVRPPVILTQAPLRPSLPNCEACVLSLDEPEAALQREPSSRPSVEVSPRQLAYIIYTSGSTGQPKGVMVEHHSLVRTIVAQLPLFDLTPESRVLSTIALSFDASLGEIFRTLLAGGTLCLARREELLPGPDLIRLLRDQHITTTTLVTAVLAALPAGEYLPELRTLTVGGEALPAELAARWSQGRRLLNGYGPTEATIGATLACGWDPARKPPLGKPLPNVRAYVLDTRMQLLPVGVPGELYLGGPGLARGYLNRPDLTAERFLADPFSGEPSARLYRTGDRVRWLPDGQLEFMGRVDEQVKVRGFRIEPGEIELVLARHPGVHQAVVLAREDTPGDKRLVAYYIVEPDADETGAEALRQHLSAALPEYMVPAAYVRLDALPLTANGKLDRRALPAPDAAAYAAREYEAPAGEIEMRLARIWADVLKLERVGRHDDFFKLGGHSLLAVTMISRMRQAGLQVDVRALFTTPTLAAVAAAVGNNDGVVEVPPNRIPPGCDAITPEMLTLVSLTAGELDRIVGSVPGGAANIQDIYPLAPLQEGLLFHHLIGSKEDPYLGEHMFGFDSRARLDRYLDALRAVIARHDILRTAVLWEGLAEPVQVVWREAPLTVEEVTLDPAAGDVAEQMRLRFGRRQFRLDVRRAPLMRLFIARDAVHHRWVVLRLTHHLLGDHTTLEVMQQEIQAHLQGRAKELPAPLPFRNLVAQARLGVSREEHEAFFREMLGDVEELTAPFGLDVRSDGSDNGESRRTVDPALAKRLRACARALGVSAASLYHLAWALVVARVSGREDVVFGTVLLGRMQGGEGSDRVLGPFINTLPVRIRISEEGVADSVRHVHGLLAKLLRHEHAPLALAQRCSAVAAPTPLFVAALNYRHSAGPAEAPGERTTNPFALAVDDLGEGFVLTAQVRSPIDPERICAFMHMALEQLSSALESAPTTPVRRLDVLPSAERRQLLTLWNASAPASPERCIHHLVEEQVDRAPDHIAVTFDGQGLSYADLDHRANQLAHRLRALGVCPEVPVGLYLERGPEAIVGLLGILKAGGVYLPLDPSLPPERLAWLLDDARPAVLLTQMALHSRLPECQASVFYLDDPAADLRQELDSRPDVEVTPTGLAYIIYTSGSTGRPKGVMIEHRSLSHTITAQVPLFGLAPDGQTLPAAGAIPQPLIGQSRVVAGHAPALQNEPDRTLAIDRV